MGVTLLLIYMGVQSYKRTGAYYSCLKDDTIIAAFRTTAAAMWENTSILTASGGPMDSKGTWGTH